MCLLGQELGENSVELLQIIRAIFFDCDEVIWVGNRIIPGAIDTIQYLKKLGKLVYYVVYSMK